MATLRLPAGALALLTRLVESACPTVPVPLAEWYDAVEGLYRPPHRARSTRDRTLQACRMAMEEAGPAATTADLTPELLARLAEVYSADRRARTAVGLLQGLRAACTLAIAKGWLSRSPFDGFRAWPVQAADSPGRGRRRHFGRAELCRWLRHLERRADDWPGFRLYCLACLYVYAGLRRDEALRLEWPDVDLVHGLIWIRPKHVPRNGRKSLKTVASAGIVPMAPELRRVLAIWKTSNDPKACPWVIPGTKRLGPWTNGTTGRKPSDAIRAAGEAVGLKGLTPHTLRHSLATHLRGHLGLSPEQVRLLLRHATVTTQELYQHHDAKNLLDLVSGLSFRQDGPDSAPVASPVAG